MSKIYKSQTELVGQTPLMEAVNFEKKLGLKARLLVKIEFFNPGGSVKDRIAAEMISAAEKRANFPQAASSSNRLPATPASELRRQARQKATE